MTKHDKRAPRIFATAIAGLCAAACGDNSDPQASDTVGGTTTTGLTTTMTVPTTSASDSSTTSVGEPMTMATAVPTESTESNESTASDTTSLSSDTSATDTIPDTTDSTSGGTPFCSEEPPEGFVGPSDATCKTEPQIGSFTPVVEWSMAAFASMPAYNQAMATPIVAPLTDDDGDGVYGSDGDLPAVLFATFTGENYTSQGVLRAIAGDGSKEIFGVPGIGACSGLAAGDLDNDGIVEIVGITLTGAARAFEHDGTAKWTSAAYPDDLGATFLSTPSIADMDGDGNPEIIMGRVILNNDGSLRGKGMYGTGAAPFGSSSFAVDTDDDGVQEVVVGNALYRPDGTAIWDIPDPDGYPAVADFDLDGGPEIVVVAAEEIRLQSALGDILWTIDNPAMKGGPPTIADFDGDGLPEIGVAGGSGYVVFDTDGAVLWQQPTQDGSAATGSAVYDFEGDGVAEVVYADEINLYVYSGIDGAVKLLYDGHNNGTLIESPIVADIDNDGYVA
jgi:hypothetical protein